MCGRTKLCTVSKINACFCIGSIKKKLALESLHGLIPLQKQMIQLQFTYVSDMILCAYYLSFRGCKILL